MDETPSINVSTSRVPDLDPYLRRLELLRPVEIHGLVTEISGLTIQADGIHIPVGEICHICSSTGKEKLSAEIVGFRGDKAILMPLGSIDGIAPYSEIVATGIPLVARMGPGVLGRVVDGLGNPIDGKGEFAITDEYIIYHDPPPPMKRSLINEPLFTGIKAIDTLTALGKGQRIGIFGGSGVGKSLLLGMIARYTKADVNVIALIGERGREVREFIENDLGEDGLRRSVVVVVTADQPALLRTRGAFLAMTFAEYFRNQGTDVMFMMDSVTRFAMAQREIGLAMGEPPTTKGYPPSAFAILPKLLERAGTLEQSGSITGLFTILVEGDDPNEPISDASRAILDGHILLSRELASQNHYPAIDVLNSVSRSMINVISEDHQRLATQTRELLAIYRRHEDLINVGAYAPGSNPVLDEAINRVGQIRQFLRQGLDEHVDFDEAIRELRQTVS